MRYPLPVFGKHGEVVFGELLFWHWGKYSTEKVLNSRSVWRRYQGRYDPW